MQRYEQFDDSGDPTGYGVMPVLTDSDVNEWAKLARFAPRAAGEEDAPWWQGIVKYGLVKAIDNTLPGQPRGIQGNTQPGSFAGQNGQSYNQRGAQNAPPTTAGVGTFMTPQPGLFGLSPLLLLGLA